MKRNYVLAGACIALGALVIWGPLFINGKKLSSLEARLIPLKNTKQAQYYLGNLREIDELQPELEIESAKLNEYIKRQEGNPEIRNAKDSLNGYNFPVALGMFGGGAIMLSSLYFFGRKKK